MLARSLVAGSVLYIFDVSVSGRTYCLLEQILKSYERRLVSKLIYSFETRLKQATRDTMGKLLATTTGYMQVLG